MVKVEFNGRFGNNLCQYILGHIISEELSYKLQAPQNNYNFLSSQLLGYEYHSPVERYSGHVIDLKKIIANKEPRKIIIEGYFQRFEYYKSYRDRINGWFNYFKDYYNDGSVLKPRPNDLILHVRGGDLWNNKHSGCQHAPIPLRFYQKVIEETDYEDVYVVTESAEDPVVKKLVYIYPKIDVLSQSVLSDFLFIYFAGMANTIALSMSTLAWWGAWLSRVGTVHFPLYGFWHPDSPRQDIDMRVTDDDRYIYHDLGVLDDWVNSPDQVAYVLKEM